MNRKAVAGALISMALMPALAVPAFGQSAPRGFGFAGKITKLSRISITVRTASGLVTDQLTSKTVVMKIAKGSLRDVTPGAFARLVLTSKTVTAISISSRTGPRPARNGRPAGSTRTPRTGRFAGGPFAEGQVVKVANGKLTVRSFAGTTTTYTLAKNVTVTKSVTGKLSDLKVGETVRVGVPIGSKVVFSVTIQSA